MFSISQIIFIVERCKQWSIPHKPLKMLKLQAGIDIKYKFEVLFDTDPINQMTKCMA